MARIPVARSACTQQTSFPEFMYLTHLSLTNYRYFSRIDAAISPGVTLLVGDNAQGKTSLLEAVYFLATFSAFATSDTRQVVNFLAAKEPLAVARIVADYIRAGRTHHLEVRLIQEQGDFPAAPRRLRREALLDGAPYKVSALLGRFNAVLFLPQMLQIIDGAPELRRRYLDMTLSQIVPAYPEALTQYRKALSQRNALLKLLQERNNGASQLAYWDEQVSEWGAKIMHARIQAIHELGLLAASTHRDLSRGTEILRLAYRPAMEPLPQASGQYALPLDTPIERTHLSLEEIRTRFAAQLESRRTGDIQSGATTIGPHRDDLDFLANGVSLGHYGSRGQLRTAMMSLKLAEVSWMHTKTGEWPVLLLDEMLAELDPTRRTDLLERLSHSEQVFATTTDLDLFTAEFIETARIWRIHAGQLEIPA
ncbi:MAG: DNA replication/repair protein RecF [Anaerolineales bacterium]